MTAAATATIAKAPTWVSTTNACNMCTPLGACLAFKGIEGCVPFLHGSQGCATYMRRYVISHYREPVDIASSALGEKQAIHGGGPNLKKGLLNVMRKYGASVIGVATTCLTETIGDDVGQIIREFRKEFGDLPLPDLVHVSTPSFTGTHMSGFHAAVAAMADQLVPEHPSGKALAHNGVNVMPGFVSAWDLRELRRICAAFGLRPTLLPDYSETLEGPALADYENIPSGGTPVAAIQAMSGARASLELGCSLRSLPSAGRILADRFGVPNTILDTPIGLRASDALLDALSDMACVPVPEALDRERGRLLDAMVDGHKYVARRRVVVYGDEDLLLGLVSLLAEIGMHPVLAATGGRTPGFADAVADTCRDLMPEPPRVLQGADFFQIAERAEELGPELLVGHSKGQRLARKLDIPLVRVGFPIHDRIGGQRVAHVGHAGALALYDRIVNALLDKKQSDSPVGYGYL